MKIKRLYTLVALMGKDYKFSFESSKHKIEYIPELNMFSIDTDCLVPMHNIREIILQKEEPVSKEIANISAKRAKKEN